MVIEKNKYRIPILLLLFGIIFCIFSAIISVGASENWFARSGAVLSFVSVVIQFILSNLKKSEIKNLFQSNISLKQKFQTIKEKDVLHDVISVFSVITGLIGTIIWGYGDLLY